jgi:hypothetical protein
MYHNQHTFVTILCVIRYTSITNSGHENGSHAHARNLQPASVQVLSNPFISPVILHFIIIWGHVKLRVGNLTKQNFPVFNELSDMAILFPIARWKNRIQQLCHDDVAIYVTIWWRSLKFISDTATPRLHPLSLRARTHEGNWQSRRYRIFRELSSAWQVSWTHVTEFALLHPVTCVQLRLITILGNCGCQFLSCALRLAHDAFTDITSKLSIVSMSFIHYAQVRW